jgi:mRNA-degrading endonuclease RelE of RelBE toxin-antitoxin system
MPLNVLASPSFARLAKKLHANDKKIVDEAVTALANDPAVGEEKRGDLQGVFVYKFKMNRQEILLAYELSPNKLTPQTLVLLGIGPHENFYTQLKR